MYVIKMSYVIVVNADSGQERRDQIGIDNITQRNVIDLSSIVPIENGDDYINIVRSYLKCLIFVIICLSKDLILL